MVTDSKRKKQKVRKSQVADLSIPKMNPKKKKQKLNVIPISPSLSKIDLGEAMKKQNDVALLLTGKVIDAVSRNSNLVFGLRLSTDRKR